MEFVSVGSKKKFKNLPIQKPSLWNKPALDCGPGRSVLPKVIRVHGFKLYVKQEAIVNVQTHLQGSEKV